MQGGIGIRGQAQQNIVASFGMIGWILLLIDEVYYICTRSNIDGAIDLAQFPTDSDIAVKRFQIEVETATGPFLGGGDPPGWIPCARR